MTPRPDQQQPDGKASAVTRNAGANPSAQKAPAQKLSTQKLPTQKLSTQKPSTQKPSAREAVLDAFEQLVIDRGERAATLDAVAAEAGVSKGGLLYHYASKNDLVTGLVERLDRLAVDDRTALREAPEGVVRRFIHSSVVVGTAFDRSYIAMTRLAQSGLYPAANTSLAGIESGWRALIEQTVGDAVVARLVMLVSDGLYYNAALFPAGTAPTPPAALDDVIGAIEQLVRARA